MVVAPPTSTDRHAGCPGQAAGGSDRSIDRDGGRSNPISEERQLLQLDAISGDLILKSRYVMTTIGRVPLIDDDYLISRARNQ